MKKITRIAAVLFMFSIPLWAQPLSVNCPIDAQPMYFDHMVGWGKNAVCWYSHLQYENGQMVKHNGYVPCND